MLRSENGGDTMTPTANQLEAIRRIAAAIVETVKETGEQGAPSGIVYAALMSQGCTLDQYQSFISALVRTGKLRQEGDLLYAS